MNNYVVKKTVYNKLVAKVNNVDTSRFVLKSKYNTNESELEKKIPGTSGLVKKADCSAKITEIESNIPSISGIATNATLTAVENKIPDVSSLVKKTDYNAIISETEKKVTDHNHDKYITILWFNNLTAKHFAARLAQKNFVRKTYFTTKLISLNKKINSSKTKHFLVKNWIKNLIQVIFKVKIVLKMIPLRII